MRNLIVGRSSIREPFYSVLLAPPRLAVGLGIALGFGVPKLAAFEAYLAEVKRSGAPAPLLLAVALLVVELVAGAALAAGFATRAAGAALTIAMAGILCVPGRTSFPWDVTPFLLGAYLFTVTGAGRWSIDSLVAARRAISEQGRAVV
ncbi:MAG: hypothetical protein U0572_00180 [Phycisphaerales bacterium]